MDPTVERRYVITLSCPDTTGIVAGISGFLAEAGGWIVEAGYHSDPDTGWFFTRQVVRADSLPFGVDELRARFAEVAAAAGRRGELDDQRHRRAQAGRAAGQQGGALPARPARAGSPPASCRRELDAVIGNHDGLGDIVRAHGVPFHHVVFPSPGATGRRRRSRGARRWWTRLTPDAIVLARFMQILPPELCGAWAGRALNIHHSFLPSFVGARPYHQAHARGVKLIGATCHYVTPDLDAGPIIEQDVIRVDHGDTVADMVRRGRDIERLVLARGLRWHLEDRVLVHGNKTVVFR